MKSRMVNPPQLYDPTPNGYSHAVMVDKPERMAFIAGQGGEDLAGHLSPDLAEQIAQAFANLRIALEAVGAEPRHVTKITTYVVDYDTSKHAAVTRGVRETFGTALPAQCLVPVPRLALDGMLFEVDAVAVL